MKYIFLTLLASFLSTTAGCTEGNHETQQNGNSQMQSTTEYYTCPMHPSVISDRPGACPVCGMALVRKSSQMEMSADQVSNLRTVSLSPTQRVLANVTTERVERRSFVKTIEAVGIVDYAEPLQAIVSARFRGRIEKLFVNFTGVQVQNGQPLFDLYSPDLLTAKQEFLLALDGLRKAKEAGDQTSIGVQERLFHATRERLRVHFGMTEDQIADLESSPSLSSTVRFHSPIRGTVLSKQVQEGQYVDEGMVLYELADLSKVWVYIDVYEKDIPLIRIGQAVEVTIESYPEQISGTVTFIDPVVNSETRTVRVRAEFANPTGLLKPKMYLKAAISKIVQGALVIPASAVLTTGKKTVVWVETQPNIFEPRNVTLGLSSDSFYQILDGLREGELVAVTGGFLIDSESALRQPTAADPHAGHTTIGEKRSTETLKSGATNEHRILVKGKYIPEVIRVASGTPVKLHFYRDEDADCTNEVIFDDFRIRRRLPARKTTTVELPASRPGEYHFTCGMGMVHGKLIVE